jgi:hypothetical protein
MTHAQAMNALAARLRRLTPQEARSGLADGSITPAEIAAAMVFRSMIAETLPQGSVERSMQVDWMGELAIIAAPFFHEEMPEIVTHIHMQ